MCRLLYSEPKKTSTNHHETNYACVNIWWERRSQSSAELNQASDSPIAWLSIVNGAHLSKGGRSDIRSTALFPRPANARIIFLIECWRAITHLLNAREKLRHGASIWRFLNISVSALENFNFTILLSIVILQRQSLIYRILLTINRSCMCCRDLQ